MTTRQTLLQQTLRHLRAHAVSDSWGGLSVTDLQVAETVSELQGQGRYGDVDLEAGSRWARFLADVRRGI